MFEPADVVITGIIRDQVEFSLILGKVVLWRDDGLLNNIIFSTWSGHLDQFSGMREMLEDRGIQIVETPMPKMASMGNVFLQKTSLIRGLSYLEGNPMVLKLRTDVIGSYILHSSAIEDLINNRLHDPMEDCWDLPKIFDSKIRILGCSHLDFFCNI